MTGKSDMIREALKSYIIKNNIVATRWSLDAGLSQNALTQFLNNSDRNISSMTLTKLAEARGTTIAAILGDITGVEASQSSIPVIGLATCSIAGWFNATPSDLRTERPAGLDDSGAFAVLALGNSMVPAGIFNGQLCICSPAASAETGDAVYIQRVDGSASLKILKGIKPGWIVLQGWSDAEPGGQQQPFTDEVKSDYIAVMAPVIYVKRK